MSKPFTRHKKPLNSDMNVVPYIDVMLVLLVIFMVTAPMLTTGVEVDLPKEQTKSITTDKKLPVIISLKKDGKLFMSYDNTLDEAVDYPTLKQIIEQLNEGEKGDLQVLINADSNNEYRQIMTLMATLQSLGVKKVGLLTDSAKTKP